MARSWQGQYKLGARSRKGKEKVRAMSSKVNASSRQGKGKIRAMARQYQGNAGVNILHNHDKLFPDGVFF